MAPYSDIQPPVQGVPVDQHNQTPIAGQQVYPQVNQQVEQRITSKILISFENLFKLKPKTLNFEF